MNRLLSLLMLIAGCADLPIVSRPDPPAASVWFASSAGHVRFAYPASWHPAADDTILTLIPAGESSIGRRAVTIDDPALPPHLPGLIPLKLVAGGFVADLKSRYKQALVSQPVDRSVAGSPGCQISAAGTGSAGDVVVTAILCVHGDAVYVIQAVSDPASAPAARRALDTVVDSIQWMD